MPLVEYTSNADATAGTQVIKGLGEDRPDIPIGGYGEVSLEEFNRLQAVGIVLRVINDSEIKPLDDLNKDELQGLAEFYGLETKSASKPDLLDAVREHEATNPKGWRSLPATATVSPAGSVATAGSEGSAAGPGGAPPAGPAGVGGGTA